MQNQQEEVIREKNEKFYELKNSSDNKNSEPIATTKVKRKENIQTAQQSL